jgi:hypothetical protein
MVVILIATGLVVRLADVGMASAFRVSSVGGGGLLTPDNLVGADQRHIAFDLLRMLLPGLFVQALVIKLLVGSARGLSIPYLGTVAVLGVFDVASLAVASVVAHGFVESRSLHALTATEPVTLYLSLAISTVTLVAQAYILQGLVELPVRRYSRVAAQSS